MKGFISDCGNYGAFPYGKQWMVIYHNEQLEVFRTLNQCKKFINSRVDSLKTDPPKKPKPRTSAKIKSRAKSASKPSTRKK